VPISATERGTIRRTSRLFEMKEVLNARLHHERESQDNSRDVIVGWLVVLAFAFLAVP
jgi:hypothetical protein